ncbi:zinc finger MYM-type protein 6-like [Triplophysa rosa]|uniref:zinc finger MYM-type protein 6-like n=1 Tax=Triplophysa rosa TaxID=992332 RepID=UPI0025462F66|nr:zinc finger MYM-type protein 6-like [Triplophysa rosa]
MDAYLRPSTSSSDAKPKPTKLRRYVDNYLELGFIQSSDGRPKCVVCLQVLANEAMKPAKLKRHLKTKHPGLKDKTIDFFRRKSEEYMLQKTRLVNLATTSEKAQRASYLVAQRLAKSKKPHSIGQELLLPAAVEMCEAVLGTEAANKLKAVPLSNDTVRRRIEELSADIQSQLLDRLRSCEQFSIQQDESTDISSAAQLIVLVRYPWEGDILEDFLFCKEVPGKTTGEEIFRLLDAFMTEARLSWEKCVAVCTDGAAAMTSRKSGVTARINQGHCNHVCLDNFAGIWMLDMLYHCEVRWLSRGKVLQRVFELRREMAEFMREEKPNIAQFFTDPESMAKLVYLADIFNILNSLNLSIQGGHTSILEVSDKITAFMKKTVLWRRRIQDGLTDMFPQLSEFLHTNNLSVATVRKVATSHLTSLSEHFSSYFSDVNTDAWDWVHDPFAPAATANGLTGKAEEQLLDLSCDRTLKARFQQVNLANFWPSLSHEYPELTAEAMQILLPFPTTYLCESSFSTLTAMKNKYRARLQEEDDLRVCLSTITPRIVHTTGISRGPNCPSWLRNQLGKPSVRQRQQRCRETAAESPRQSQRREMVGAEPTEDDGEGRVGNPRSEYLRGLSRQSVVGRHNRNRNPGSVLAGVVD